MKCFYKTKMISFVIFFKIIKMKKKHIDKFPIDFLHLNRHFDISES